MKHLFLYVCLAALSFSCNSDDDAPEPEPVNYEYTQEEKDAEIARLKNYIAEQGYSDVQETESGLHYSIEQQGDGLTPTMDDTVIAHFETTNMETDELLGVSNREENQYGQILIMNNLLEGVSEGFMLVNEGAIIRMFVPAYLAYGKRGNFFGDIDPETNMMFKMELNIVLKP